MAQWNKTTQDFLNQERSLFEVYNIADHWGNQTDWRPQFTNNNRFKISPYQTVFFNTFQYGKETDVWDERVVGVGTATFNVNASNVVMEVGSTAGSKIVRQTKNVMRYIPGRGATLAFAIRLDTPQVGIRRRFGLFDENNGVYFEDDGGTYSYVLRSSVTGIVSETRVYRDDWSGEKFDGTGVSGYTLDISKAQILWMDIEWLGLGTVRVGFVIDGNFVHCHSFHHANIIQSTYITTASLPLRYEIANTGITTSSSTLKQVCSTVISEGGYELRGLQQAVNTPITAPVDLPSPAGTYYPVISIRLKSSPDRLDAIAIMTALSLMGISLVCATNSAGADVFASLDWEEVSR
jgi:hypothetical protein